MRYKIFISFIIATLLVFVAGCQKDQDFLAVAKSGSTAAAGFGISNLDGISIGVDASVTKLDTAVKVFIGTTYGSATTVSLAIDTSIVNAYNNDNGTDYDYLPAAVYTLPTSVTIPAGQHEGDGKLSVDITKFLSYGTQFALGVAITKVSGGPNAILTDHSKFFIVIQVKNPYEADYAVTGYLYHPTGPRAIKLTKHVTTAGAATSYADLGDLGTSGYGFQFDVASNNKLTNWVGLGAAPAAPKSGFMALDNGGGIDYVVTSSGLAPVNPGTAPWQVSTYNNTYDPATGTFWMHYGYYSAASPLPGTGEVTYSRLVYEKWVKQ